MLSVDQIFLDAFSEEVEDYASRKTNNEFFNSGESHAQIVLNNIAKYSENKIRIYCGNLCTEISNNDTYLHNLKNFLKLKSGDDGKPKGEIDVILCEFDNSITEKEIFTLFSLFPNKVRIKKTDKILYDNIGNKIHFTVADNKAYRLEVDTKLKKAKCNFNDEKTSKILIDAFDDLFKDSASKVVPLS